MAKSTDSASYDAVAKTLHWLIALAIIVMLVIGWTMMNLPRENALRFPLFQLHKSIGITILLLSLLRLYWRLTHKAPPFPITMPAWEKFAAHATHFVFYLLIIGMPITGWVIVSTSPIDLPTMLYGIIPWPHFPGLSGLENKKDINHAFAQVHSNLAYLITGLLVLHVAAAHKHHWIDGDDILVRMAPGPIARILNRLRGKK